MRVSETPIYSRSNYQKAAQPRLSAIEFTFTPKSDQLQFSLSVSYQRYIIQYGEFVNR